MLVTNHPKNTIPTTLTQNPIIQGSSVVALRYNGGVLVACDAMMTFGSGMSKFFKQDRIAKLNGSTLFASSGELSDYQVLLQSLQQLQQQNDLHNDGVTLTPQNYLSYLAYSQYSQRNKFDPYLINGIIAGPNYLGFTDAFGTKLESDYVVTGMAMYMCRHIITNYWNPLCTEEQAREVLKQCFRVLYYRHTRANDLIQIAKVDVNGAVVEDFIRLDTKWDHKGYIEAASEKLHAK